MPSQKEGVARPAIEKVRTTRSIQVFCFRAEIVPSGIAIETAMTVARIATSSEIGNRVAISMTTGFPDHRLAEIEPRQAPQEIEELHDPGPVDADLGMAGGERCLGEAGAPGAEAHEADIA